MRILYINNTMKRVINILKNFVDFLRNRVTLALLIVVALLLCYMSIQCSRIEKLSEENNTFIKNIKAYENENSQLKKGNYEFSMTIDELKASNDSINKKMLKTYKELDKKTKDLKYAQYLLSKGSKTDTIHLSDTVFNDGHIMLDTTFGDKWFSTHIEINSRIPLLISTSNFTSELEAFISTNKETVNPPNKLFFIRWFQKKHRVTVVDVKENNPYVTIEKSRFIKINEK